MFDTRSKILTPEKAVETAARLRENGAALAIVTGYFDPLLAEHARRLTQARGHAAALMVIIASPPNPILPAPARAELVAALAVVDYVVLPDRSDLEELLARMPADAVARHEESDEQRTQDLIRHVHRRQQAR